MSGSPTSPAPPSSANLHFDLSQGEFKKIAELLRQETGISLADSKLDLVQGRLRRRLRSLGIRDFAQYIDIVTDPDAVD